MYMSHVMNSENSLHEGQLRERRGSFSETLGIKPSGCDPSSLWRKKGLQFLAGGQGGSRVAREPAWVLLWWRTGCRMPNVHDQFELFWDASDWGPSPCTTRPVVWPQPAILSGPWQHRGPRNISLIDYFSYRLRSSMLWYSVSQASMSIKHFRNCNVAIFSNSSLIINVQ